MWYHICVSLGKPRNLPSVDDWATGNCITISNAMKIVKLTKNLVNCCNLPNLPNLLYCTLRWKMQSSQMSKIIELRIYLQALKLTEFSAHDTVHC